jgi:hypothetical protein
MKVDVHVYHWIPGMVAVATVIANAAITYSAVSRHERVIEDLTHAVQELRTAVAVLKYKTGGGDVNDG